MVATLLLLCGLLGFMALFTVASIHGERIERRQEQERLAWKREQARKRAVEERRLRALRMADVDNMKGIEFEHYICRLLVHKGYKARVTKASGDFGADILADRNGVTYSIQTKRHKNTIDRHAVNDAINGRDIHERDRAMAVTNSYFTPGAIRVANTYHCRLVDRDELAKWIFDFQNPDVPEFTVAGFEDAWVGEHFLTGE